MHVDPAQSASHQPPLLDEPEHFAVVDDRRLSKGRKKRKDLGAIGEVSTRELPDDERVSPNFTELELFHKPGITMAQVIYPDRRIDEHATSLATIDRRALAVAGQA